MNKRFNKIASKIDIIAKKGIYAKFEYFQYVDEIIQNGLYSIFQDVMYRKYNIDLLDSSTVENAKIKTFSLIRNQTVSKFQEDLKRIYDSLGVIQMGQSIIRLSDNAKLGTIVEEDILRIYRGDSFNINFNDKSLSNYKLAIIFLLQTTITSYVDDDYADSYFN